MIQETNGKWDFPGGGLDFGETCQECLIREVREEMGLQVVHVSENPFYFLTTQDDKQSWFANIFFEVILKNFDFTPSNECINLKFFTPQEALQESLFPNVQEFILRFLKSDL